MEEDLNSRTKDEFPIKMNDTVEKDDIECNLVFHGAAASSSSHSVVYLKETDALVYASHGLVNLATKPSSSTTSDRTGQSAPMMRHVHQTLRTDNTGGSAVHDGITSNNVITCLTQVQDYHSTTIPSSAKDDTFATTTTNDIACGFSNGTFNLWWWVRDSNTYEEEITTSTPTPSTATAISPTYSVTDIAAMNHIPIRTSTTTSSLLLVVTASCTGVTFYSRCNNDNPSNNLSDNVRPEEWTMQNPPSVSGGTTSSVATVLLQRHESLLLLFAGSAIPRVNRIRIFTIEVTNDVTHESSTATTVCKPLWDVIYQGHLVGHQDWITCMDWTTMKPNNSSLPTSSTSISSKSYLLASGSQDAKIRLWKFLHTTTTNINDTTTLSTNDTTEKFALIEDEEEEDDLSSIEGQETLVEDEEARLVLQHHPPNYGKTAVTLEAILVGHEDIVTSVSWRPNSTKNILLSSSMDRSILLWSLEDEENDNTDYSKDTNNNIIKPTSSCWIPHARIGVAGGILGASIGSSLLGFVDAVWVDDTTIVGHGYGGTLYFWNCTNTNNTNQQQYKQKWKAQPPLTGHFRSVNDLSWEPTNGDFLLTVSSDQTCRLMAPIPNTSSTNTTITDAGGDTCGDSTASRCCCYWREVGRPQVHGYDIHAVSCIGGVGDEPYGRFISGSSEKQLRAFDAPCATLRLLDRISHPLHHDATEVITSRLQGRPEKSYLPSLGLTNKAVEHDGDAANEEYDSNCNEEDLDSSTYESKKTSDPDYTSTIEDILPRERELGTSTLWPEVTQLFGHPTDIICVASTSRCKLNVSGDTDEKSMVIVASSCKARNSEQASIRLWNVSRGSCIGTLKVTRVNDDYKLIHMESY